MDRKRIFRRATSHKAQLKRSGAEEFAEEFPEGPLGAPNSPLESESDIRNEQKDKKENK